MDADTTELLVARAKRGERDAFASLARAYMRSAYAVALAILGRPADAEDVAHTMGTWLQITLVCSGIFAVVEPTSRQPRFYAADHIRMEEP